MRVVLDTSVIIASGYTMSNTTFRVFLEELERAGHSLYIPQIVCDEVQNKYKETLKTQLRKFTALANKLGRLTDREPKKFIRSIDDDQLQKRYKQLLEERFAQVHAQILDYPAVSHQKIVQRALDRRKPFDSKGREGYRDTLIWETVIELAKNNPEEPVVFISSNLTDFANSNDDGCLHSDLQNEIELLNNQCSEILYFDKLESFVDQHILPTLEILETIRDQLAKGEYPNLNLEGYVVSSISSLLDSPNDPRNRKVLGLPSEYEDIRYDDITAIWDIQVLDVRRLSTGELLIDFSGFIDPDFEFSVHSSNYDRLSEEEQWSVVPSDYLEGYMEGLISIAIKVELSMIFDPNSNKVVSLQIKSVESETIKMYRSS